MSGNIMKGLKEKKYQIVITLLQALVSNVEYVHRDVQQQVYELTYAEVASLPLSLVCFLYTACQQLNLTLSSNIQELLEAKASRNYQANLFRLNQISGIAEYGIQNNIPVLFLKGGASLAMLSGSKTFLTLETMGDVDFLCLPDDIETFHQYCVESGSRFYDYGLSGWLPMSVIKQFSLQSGKHLIYDYNQWERQLELHETIAVEKYAEIFPKNFMQTLWETSQKTTLNNVPVTIPGIEQIIIYCFGHAAETDMLYNMATTVWESPASRLADIKQLHKGWRHIVANRVQEHQIKFLLKLYGLIAAFDGEVNWNTVCLGLKSVKDQRALLPYIQFAQLVLGDVFLPLSQCVSNGMTWSDYNAYRDELIATSTPTSVCVAAYFKFVLFSLPGFKWIKKVFLYVKIRRSVTIKT